MAESGKRARPASPVHRFRRRELELPEGGKLVLHTDGSIAQLSAGNETVATWAEDDPEWPRHAIRFGLFPQSGTVAPPDTRVRGSRPPGG